MTCAEIQALLPGSVYGDLPADEAAVVSQHLQECPACQAEVAALTGVRSALDATPTPPVRVDVPALFAAVADRQVRRWRRLALAGAASAAGLLLVLGLRLHVTAGNGQVVIAWGSVVSRDADTLRSGARSGENALRFEDSAARLTELDGRVRLQQELILALASDIETRDRRRGSEIDFVRVRLEAMQQYAARHWADAERTMNALSVAQYKRPEEKANP